MKDQDQKSVTLNAEEVAFIGGILSIEYSQEAKHLQQSEGYAGAWAHILGRMILLADAMITIGYSVDRRVGYWSESESGKLEHLKEAKKAAERGETDWRITLRP